MSRTKSGCLKLIIDSISHETPHRQLGLLFEHLGLIIYSLLSLLLVLICLRMRPLLQSLLGE